MNNEFFSVIKEYIDELQIASIEKIRNDLILYKLKEFLECMLAKTNDANIIKQLKKIMLIKINFNKHDNEKEKIKIKQLKELCYLFNNSEDALNFNKRIQDLEIRNDLYNIWINWAIIRIDYVTNATHVAKLSHSSSAGISIVDSIPDQKNGYLTTSCFDELIYDGAYPNGDLSKIVKFLLLKSKNKTLADVLRTGDVSCLAKFASSDNELRDWESEFEARLNPTSKADALAKQVYFPVDDGYHLLVVLKSSSLIQKIYIDYFHKDIRKQRDKVYKLVQEKKYSPNTLEVLPNVTTLSTVTSQPQNVSVLHGSRGGNIRLFSCEPPHWQSTLRPPIYKKSIFHDSKLNMLAKEAVLGLAEMLVTFENAEISFKEPNRYRGISNWVISIAESVIDYAQIMISLPPNWSANSECRLDINHQYFLDPYRDDDEFISNRKAADWQRLLTKDFVSWLNEKIAGPDRKFTLRKEHSRAWRDIFMKILREYQEDIDCAYINKSNLHDFSHISDKV